MNIGKRQYIKDNIEVADTYLRIAQKDEKAAIELEKQKLYNQSAYFYIQAMEKQVKNHIARKVDITNEYFANKLSKTMGHSLDESLELLLRIYSGNNEILFQQMQEQLLHQILKDVNFQFLHNSVRYPIYKYKFKDYDFNELTIEDCYKLKEMLVLLKKYLKDLDRV